MAFHSSPPGKQRRASPSPNWLELPDDLCSSIIRRLDVVEILYDVQYVCSKWRRICRDPSMFRSLDIRSCFDLGIDQHSLSKVYRLAADLSSGGILDINIESFVSNGFLCYVTDRSKHLRRLRLVHRDNINDRNFMEVLGKIPELEELDLSYCDFSSLVVTEAGRLCPRLVSFKWNSDACMFRYSHEGCSGVSDDEVAFAIAKNMPGLRHLQIFGNKLTNVGLIAILDNCPRLESLDLRQCFHIDLDAGLKNSERIKYFRGPNDSTDDHPFDCASPYEPCDDDNYDPYPNRNEVSDYEFMSDDDGGWHQNDMW